MSKLNTSQTPQTATTTLIPAPSGILQRKCASCGTHTIAGGKCEDCKDKKGVLQRKSSNNSEHSEVPPIVYEVLNSSGQPLDKSTRAFFEPRFAHNFSRVPISSASQQLSHSRLTVGEPKNVYEQEADRIADSVMLKEKHENKTLSANEGQDGEQRAKFDLSEVRVHTDARAAESACAINALAYTIGNNIVFGAGHFAPGTHRGRRLIAHELTHVMQQPSLGRIRRVPAPPKAKSGTAAPYDRSKIEISAIADMVATPNAAGTLSVNPQPVTAKSNDSAVKHFLIELYDPKDTNLLQAGWARLGAVAMPYVFPPDLDPAAIVQGRYTWRCVGVDDKGEPLVYADRTFFVWTSTPTSEMSLTDLKKIKNKPDKHSLGEVGAAQARSMMLEHKEAVAATGTGTVQGNQCSAPTAGVGKSDCTNYVLDVLKFAFTAKGRSADWDTVFKEAQKTSAGKFKGNELVKALISKAGWKAVFWAPNPRNPADKNPEHPTAYKRVRDEGEYRSANETTGIPVDASKSVIDYRKTATTKQDDMTGIDKLHKIPLAVITAKGGRHMTLLLSGQVYEVHWDKPATDPNVIEATPLEKWDWESGAVVMPSEDYAKAF